MDKYITDNTGKPDVYIPNLKGFIVGNGVTDWKYDGKPALFDMAYWFGLIDDDLYDNVKTQCDLSYYLFDAGKKLSDTCKGYMDKFDTLLNQVNHYDLLGKCYTTPS